jgi:hypothetical protein
VLARRAARARAATSHRSRQERFLAVRNATAPCAYCFHGVLTQHCRMHTSPLCNLDVRMPRMTIYVADELKERMDQLGNRANWSAAAQRAFEQIVDRERWKQMTDGLERATERLRQSKAIYEEAEKQRGLKAGGKWALGTAGYGVLEALERTADDGRGGLCELNASQVAEISYGYSPPREHVSLWWGEEFEALPSQAYVDGFVQGAIEVFREVKERL